MKHKTETASEDCALTNASAGCSYEPLAFCFKILSRRVSTVNCHVGANRVVTKVFCAATSSLTTSLLQLDLCIT